MIKLKKMPVYIGKLSLSLKLKFTLSSLRIFIVAIQIFANKKLLYLLHSIKSSIIQNILFKRKF